MRTIAKLFLLILVIAVVTTACGVPFQSRQVKGSGEIVVEDRKVSGFDKILVEGVGRLILTQGDSESLSIETDDNLMEFIRTEVVGDTLEIGFEDDVVLSSNAGGIGLDPTDGFIFYISVIDLQEISISGAADIEMEKIKTDHLDINLSGAGLVAIDDLDASTLRVHISGAGDVNMGGRVVSQVVMLSGLGRYQAFNLESQDAAVTISGAGGANVWVIDSLKVSISGAGDVKYYGSPSVTQNNSGLGRVQSEGDK